MIYFLLVGHHKYAQMELGTQDQTYCDPNQPLRGKLKLSTVLYAAVQCVAGLLVDRCVLFDTQCLYLALLGY